MAETIGELAVKWREKAKRATTTVSYSHALEDCAKDLEALAAAAPAPPAATPVDEPKNDERGYGCYACGKQGLKKGQRISLVFCNECDDKYSETIRKAQAVPPDCPVKGISCDAPCKDYPRCAAQDGQGAELLGPPPCSKCEEAHRALDTYGVARGAMDHSVRYRIGLLAELVDLGPPRGGSSSDLADQSTELRAATVQGYNQALRDAERACRRNTAGCDKPNVACHYSDVEAIRALTPPSLPEAVAGNASAPVGEKRQPSGVGEPREPKTARELAEALCDCADRTLNGRARELANELREELLEVCRDWTRTVLAREVGEGLGEVAPDLKVPFQKLLTVLLIQDRSQEQASTDVATIKKNDSTVLRIGSEMYFHQLRLECAKDSTLLDKIAVFYRDENNVLHSVGLRFEDELRWPPGFLQEALDLELAIRQVRHPALAAPAPKPAPTAELTVEQMKVIVYDALKHQFPAVGAAMMVASCCAQPIHEALRRAAERKPPR